MCGECPQNYTYALNIKLGSHLLLYIRLHSFIYRSSLIVTTETVNRRLLLNTLEILFLEGGI